ncbi:hypothetical protein [Burkholderia stagnalis]|uniref:Uncharacterized protein n=1 Tax=Burkholderia stagnalis TaxID=1503054 RepID=A0A6L3N0Q3_9BURK|nr:hypothetical protein [Burkholderia stagnalis]KAB0639606.1 hypothetical protein F7R25_08380 [Burkholderia stagnalis]
MRVIAVWVATTVFSISFQAYAADISKTFVPSPGAVAVVQIKGSNLIWKLSGKDGVRQGGVNLDTVKKPNIEIDSYDFSGRLGFRVSHIDDGMGTYEIDRIFTFSPSSNKFMERFPSCGDEFVNVRVDKKRRYLVSTYWNNNIPKRCITRLPFSR